MQRSMDTLLAVAASLVAAGIAWYFKGPHAGLVIAGVGIVLLIVVFLATSAGQSKNGSPPQNRVFLGADLSPEALCKVASAYTEIQAKKVMSIYIGKWMRVSGAIESVNRCGPDECLVAFGFHPRIFMIFGKRWIEELSVLSLGAPITVIGRLKEVSSITVGLEECELVTPSPGATSSV